MTASSMGFAVAHRGRIASLVEAARILAREVDAPVARRLLLTVVLILGAASLGALAPVALKLAVESLGKGISGTVLLVPALFIMAYAGTLWLAKSLGELRGFIFGAVEQTLARRLSRRLFAHLLALPLARQLERRTGAVGQTLRNGLLGFRLLVQQSVAALLPVLVELLMTGAVLISLGHTSILFILGLSALAHGVAIAIGLRRIAPPARAASSAMIDAGAAMADSLLNYEAIKSYLRESWAEERYDRALTRVERSWTRVFRTKASIGLVIAGITSLTLGGTLVLAAHQVTNGTMTVGDFVLVNAYVLQIVRPLEMLGLALRDIAQASAFLEKMMDLLRQDTETPEDWGHVRLSPGPLDLGVQDVSFTYDRDQPTLREVSFNVPAGRTVALVGASGAGKSTVARLLPRFVEPDKGEIRLNGVSLGDIALSDLRRSVVIVPQDTILLNDTIATNIALSRPDASPAEIERAAQLACIDGFISTLPAGYETVVGERGLKLSGGERQRIGIARAALARPSLLILDEATSHLDLETERALLEALPAISRGATTLLITHRLSAIAHADDILVFYGGRLVESGSHLALLARKGHYAALWRAQQPRLVSEADILNRAVDSPASSAG